MKEYSPYRKHNYLFGSITFVLLAGCASVSTDLAPSEPLMSKPLQSGQARIRLVRSSITWPAPSSPQGVYDCGSNIEYNATMLEEGQIQYGEPIEGTIFAFPDLQKMKISYKKVTVSEEQPKKKANEGYGNYLRDIRHEGQYSSVIQMKELLPPTIPFSKELLKQRSRLPGEEYLVNGNALFVKGTRMSVVNNDSYMWGEFLLPDKLISMYLPEGSKVLAAIELLKPNARYLGLIDASGWLIFDRPAGIMSLKTVSANSAWEGFAPDIKIEAGRIYDVEYTFGITGILFTVKELQ